MASSNPFFQAITSSDDIYFGQDADTCITDVVNNKSDLDHTHSGYASQSDLELLEDTVDTKADSVHSHTEYATTTALAALETEVDGKANANHSHTEYASVGHSHDNYALSSHSHSDYASVNHDHDEDYASVNHIHSNYATTSSLDEVSATVANKANVIDLNSHINNTVLHITEAERTNWNAKSDFSGSYNDLTNKPSIPSISGLATETYVDEAVSSKANTSHSHDDRYYTETEINTKLANKADYSHNHTGVYDVNGAAASALTSANAYTDTKINALVGEGASTTLDTIGEISSAIEENQDAIDLLNSAIGTKANASDLTSHTGNKSNPHAVTKSQVGLGNVPNVTTNDQTPTYSDATTLSTLVSGEKLSVAFGKIKLAISNLINHIANKSNPHSVTKSQIGLGNVDNTSDANKPISTATQTALDGKASSSHTHNVATASSAGFMSASDKSKLDGITASADSVSFSCSLTSGTKVGTITINGTGTDLYAPTNTDTHYVSGTVVGSSASAISNTTSALTNGNVYMNHIENGSVKNSHKISGSGATTVTSDTSGNIVVSSTNTTYGVATSSGLGLVKSGTDITVDSSGNVSVNDDSHNHVISNIDNLQTSLDAKQTTVTGGASTITSSNLTTNRALVSNSSGKVAVSAVTSTELGYLDGVTSNVQTQLDGKAASSHNHSASNITSGTLSSDRLPTVPISKGGTGATTAAAALTNLGITATATELNYVDGVTSNIQTQLNGKSSTSHTHNYAGSSSAGGAATSANKLATARTISLSGDVSGSTSFDGSGNVSITTVVADDSHNHVISNVDGLQTALDGKSATSHNHNSAYIAKSLQFTNDTGGVKLSYVKDDNINILDEFVSLSIGFYTVYTQSGVTGNPKTTEAWRYLVHKTGSAVCWVQAYGSIGSVYTNYYDGSSGWRGWKCLWDNSPAPLWTGAVYMTSTNGAPQVVTPSKKLSECQHGWLLLWSDYDPGDGANDADFVTTMIPKRNATGGTWGGKSFLCDIPRYVGSDATDTSTEKRIIKPIYVHDDCIKGSYQNASGDRNDVVLRAVYEY